MTIDTSREAVERLLDGVTPGPWDFGQDPDEGIGRGYFVFGGGYCRANMVGPPQEQRPNARFTAAARDLVPALLAERDAALAEVARLSHALAAETAKREAMEEALTGLLEPFGDDPCRYDHHGKCQEHFIEDDCCVARARATLAKHGSKT